MSRRILIIGAQGALVLVLILGVYMSFLKPEDSGELQSVSTPSTPSTPAGPGGPGGPQGGRHQGQGHPHHPGKPGGGGKKGKGKKGGGNPAPGAGAGEELAFTDGVGVPSGPSKTSPSNGPTSDQYADTASDLEAKAGGSEHVPLFGP